MNIRTSLFACTVVAIAALSFGAPVASADTVVVPQDMHQHGDDASRGASDSRHDESYSQNHGDDSRHDRYDSHHDRYYSHHRGYYSHRRARVVCTRYRHHRCVRWSRVYRRN